VAVRRTLIAIRHGARTVATSVLKVKLIGAAFAIAPGTGAVVRSRLSPHTRALLSRLGRGPIDVAVEGQGIVGGVVRLRAG